jgi:hypothetical protein
MDEMHKNTTPEIAAALAVIDAGLGLKPGDSRLDLDAPCDTCNFY